MELEPTIILFALADSQLWSNADFANWATDNGEKDLAIQLEVDDPLEVFRAQLVSNGLVLPCNYGDLLGGLLWLRRRRAKISNRECMTLLIDAWDAYPPSRFDVEALSASEPELVQFLSGLADDAEAALQTWRNGEGGQQALD